MRRLILSALLVLVLVETSSAQAFLPGYQYRRKFHCGGLNPPASQINYAQCIVRFSSSATMAGTDVMTNFNYGHVLANGGFPNCGPGMTSSGCEIRFTDLANNEYFHEWERYNDSTVRDDVCTTGACSVVKVGLTVPGGGAKDGFIYYGNASPPSTDNNCGGQQCFNSPSIYQNTKLVWTLRDTSGAVAVDDMNLHNGSFINSPTLNQQGKIDGSTLLTATSHHYIQAASSTDFEPTAMTVSLWLKPSSLIATQQELISRWFAGGTEDFAFDIAAGPGFYYRLAICNVTQSDCALASICKSVTGTPPSFTPGTWTQLVGTWDGGVTDAAVKIYKDGVSVGNTNCGVGSFTGIGASAVPLTVGSLFLGNLYLDGTVDDVRFSTEAWTADRVKLNYDTGRGQFLTFDTEETNSATPTPSPRPTDSGGSCPYPHATPWPT